MENFFYNHYMIYQVLSSLIKSYQVLSSLIKSYQVSIMYNL